MKLLLVADSVHEALYTHFDRDRWSDVDLILSAGDLKAEYLSFLVTLINGAPLYYVRGNHDKRYEQRPPLGCEDIHGRIVNFKGLNILGLEGSNWYNGQGIQYRERQMKWQVLKVLPHLLFNRDIDIILTHAPPAGFHDSNKSSHRGFDIFRYLIDKLNPDYFIHGHIHMSYTRDDRIIEYKDTKIINAYQYYELDLDREN
ncbi:MAG: metallophosphoesterase family protein [Halanaerobiaceae bacterium]